MYIFKGLKDNRHILYFESIGVWSVAIKKPAWRHKNVLFFTNHMRNITVYSNLPWRSLHHSICIFHCAKQYIESLLPSSTIRHFEINRNHRGLCPENVEDSVTQGCCALLRTASKWNELAHCPSEKSRILHDGCFMQNLTNTSFVDSCQISKSLNTQTTIFADKLTNFFNVYFIFLFFWGAVPLKARIVFDHYSSLFKPFKPIKNLSTCDKHFFNTFWGSFAENLHTKLEVNRILYLNI